MQRGVINAKLKPTLYPQTNKQRHKKKKKEKKKGKKTFFLNICEKYKVSKGKSHLPKINMEKRNEQEARKCLHYDSSM